MSERVGRPWRRLMVARDRDEAHRAATPLELLFDLCFVVAVGQAAGQLHRALAEGRVADGLLGYLMVFFAIWWAWMNFTWFASAYDTDDVPYRLLTLLQIAGVLVLAAGVPAAFNSNDARAVVLGYVLIRMAMVLQWLRAAHDFPPTRSSSLRFAFGIGVCQVAWVARLAVPGVWFGISFVALVALELCVPIWAERIGQPTGWHPEHIAERYGCFTLIVLGECVLAATTAIQAAVGEGGPTGALLLTAVGGLLLIFALWWSYFKVSVADGLRESLRVAFVWGYGHFVVFAAVAALGAGLQLAAEVMVHTARVGEAFGAFAVAIPTAIYLITLAVLHGPLNQDAPVSWPLLAGSMLVLLVLPAATVFVPLAVVVLLMGAVVVALVAATVIAGYRRRLPG